MEYFQWTKFFVYLATFFGFYNISNKLLEFEEIRNKPITFWVSTYKPGKKPIYGDVHEQKIGYQSRH